MTLSIMLNEPGGVRTDVVSGRINVRYMTTVNTQTKAVEKKKSLMCVNNTVMSFCFDIIFDGAESGNMRAKTTAPLLHTTLTVIPKYGFNSCGYAEFCIARRRCPLDKSNLIDR